MIAMTDCSGMLETDVERITAPHLHILAVGCWESQTCFHNIKTDGWENTGACREVGRRD